MWSLEEQLSWALPSSQFPSAQTSSCRWVTQGHRTQDHSPPEHRPLLLLLRGPGKRHCASHFWASPSFPCPLWKPSYSKCGSNYVPVGSLTSISGAGPLREMVTFFRLGSKGSSHVRSPPRSWSVDNRWTFEAWMASSTHFNTWGVHGVGGCTQGPIPHPPKML